MAKQAQIDAVKPALEATDKVVSAVEKALDNVDKVADKSTDVVESALETVADVVPEALDTAVHVSTEGGRKLARLFRDPKRTAITIVVLSATAGAALGVAGYFAMIKRLEAKLRKEYDEELESQIAEVRRFYATRERKDEFATPAEAVEALMPPEAKVALKSYNTVPSAPVVVPGVPIVETEAVTEEVKVDVAALREKMQSGTPVEVTETTTNIFVEGNPVTEFDYATELPRRGPDAAYVVTHDEFMENENGFEQHQLTYYSGDDILTDEKDVPIPDIEELIGSENLTRFGYGSRDANVVYVCNEKIEGLYEIMLSQGSYAQEVAGFQHSAPIRRFRPGRDE